MTEPKREEPTKPVPTQESRRTTTPRIPRRRDDPARKYGPAEAIIDDLILDERRSVG